MLDADAAVGAVAAACLLVETVFLVSGAWTKHPTGLSQIIFISATPAANMRIILRTVFIRKCEGALITFRTFISIETPVGYCSPQLV